METHCHRPGGDRLCRSLSDIPGWLPWISILQPLRNLSSRVDEGTALRVPAAPQPGEAPGPPLGPHFVHSAQPKGCCLASSRKSGCKGTQVPLHPPPGQGCGHAGDAIGLEGQRWPGRATCPLIRTSTQSAAAVSRGMSHRELFLGLTQAPADGAPSHLSSPEGNAASCFQSWGWGEPGWGHPHEHPTAPHPAATDVSQGHREPWAPLKVLPSVRSFCKAHKWEHDGAGGVLVAPALRSLTLLPANSLPKSFPAS